ncbi:MAG: CbiX/SirB N-terminal domain-containing protein [Deltaproteobacteria bacterium]|nr:CbiX/SirB N-terminal domain-containing protein [Deltaproteobacteria bacterium]
MNELNSKSAIILLGHGSRVPEAGKHMEQVAIGLRTKYVHELVEICYMSRLGPHFPDALKKCVALGATDVLVIPYFLHEGLHMKLDIPEMMQDEAEKYPTVKLVLGRHLGFDDSLVDLVEKRIGESRSIPDIKETILPPKDKYPVPPGQCVFVPMLPEEAEKVHKD